MYDLNLRLRYLPVLREYVNAGPSGRREALLWGSGEVASC